MTEEEAKTKWCPFARVMNINGDGGGNRWDGTGKPHDSPANSLCLGSACMAWRWDDARNESAMEAYEDSFAIGGIDSREQPTQQGYCGLAGKPSGN